MADDYTRITHAIHYIRTHLGTQPSLTEIANEINLSEHHFQRLFSRWAGVTPKRFLQVLTLERAKTLLDHHQTSTLNTSYAVGLSSGSRLYDHFVQIEGVTPSEYKQKGKGLNIVYGYHESPFGLLFLAQTPRGICRLEFVAPQALDEPLQRLRKSWPNAEIHEDNRQTTAVFHTLFSSQPSMSTMPLSLWVRGTNFQLSVWRALLNIQHGDLVSYKAIANEIGKPKAVRAVGSAVGANPVALIIPCHRVLRQNGELGGYRWGETRKHAILAREFAHCE